MLERTINPIIVDSFGNQLIKQFDTRVVEYVYSDSSSTLESKVGVPRETETIESFYPLQLKSESQLNKALRLINQLFFYVDEAYSVYNLDPIKSDDNCSLMIGELYELYCLRQLGDGFSMMINALLNALINQNGERLEHQQLMEIRFAILKFKKTPLLNSEEATLLIEPLEEVNLNIFPDGLEEVLELMNAK